MNKTRASLVNLRFVVAHLRLVGGSGGTYLASGQDAIDFILRQNGSDKSRQRAKCITHLSVFPDSSWEVSCDPDPILTHSHTWDLVIPVYNLSQDMLVFTLQSFRR